jgi:hypothetical protein
MKYYTSITAHILMDGGHGEARTKFQLLMTVKHLAKEKGTGTAKVSI